MPLNPNKCDNVVNACFPCHTICHRKRSVFKTGAFLNKYIKTEDEYLSEKLEGRKNYQICYNLCGLFDRRIQKELKKKERPKETAVLEVNPSIHLGLGNEVNRSSRRTKRAMLRDGIFDEEKVKRLTTVTIKCDGTIYDESINLRYKRRGKKEKYVDELENLSRQYKFPFRRLKWRQRIERIDDVAKRIIAMCVDSAELSVGGLEYLNGNLDLSHDILNIVHGIKERLELKLKVDLDGIEFPDPCDYVADEVVEEDGRDENESKLRNRNNNKVGSTIMIESSGRGYERIRAALKVEKKIVLPSLYKLNKELPLQVICLDCTIDEKKEEKIIERNEVLLGLTPSIKTEEEVLILLSDNLEEDEDGKRKIVGAKLDGNFDAYINLMLAKQKQDKDKMCNDGDDLILLNLFDGAEAIKMKSKVTSIINFSSSISTTNMIQHRHVQAGSSLNILTWQQMIAKEELSTMLPALQSFLASRKKYVADAYPLQQHPRSKLWCYDLHDVKMLYLLTQHSLWNRKHHPFLLCSCKRNIGVLNNEEHICKFTTDDQYKIAWQRSLKRWEAKRRRLLPNKSYDESHHKDWCDSSNDGVTHFGVHPDSLPISSIRFDMFHLSAAITRRIMNYMRNLMLKQSSQIKKEFTNSVLLQFWPEFHVYCWNNKLNFSKFQGRELSLFISNITRVKQFINDKLVQTHEIEKFSIGISLLTPIFKFMSVTYITDIESYQDSMQSFKTDVRALYACGKHTFLSTGDEPFYFHCLCYYLPQIAEITYTRHKLGLGIFTMQGFERRNKESKAMIRKSCTSNRNSPSLLVNNIKRLQQLFWYNIKAY